MATLVAILGAVAAALRPELFWTESTAQHVWGRSGIVTLLGLIAAVAWLPRRSIARLVGAIFLLFIAAALFVLMPDNELEMPASLATRAVVVTPAVLAVPWFLPAPAGRARELGAANGRPGVSGAMLVCNLSLVALSAWTFLRANVFQPRIGIEQALVCLDRESGAPLWQTVLFHTTAEHLATYRTSHATPTPASDGEYVVAYFGTGVACLDLAGRVRWKHEFSNFSTTSIYGAGSSPVIVGNRMIVVQERERQHELRPSFLAAYALDSGALLWRVESEHARGSYSTPLLLPSDAPTEFVTATWHALVSHDLATGARLWSRELRIEETVTSLVADADRLYFAGGSIAGMTVALALPGPDRHAPEVLWQTRRATPSCASPVVEGGRLYTVTQGGLLSAYEAASGVVLWQQRLEPGDYYASLLVGDGKLYVSNADGRTSVVRAEGEFVLVAENDLGEGMLASPAVAGGRLYLRGLESVVCIE